MGSVDQRRRKARNRYTSAITPSPASLRSKERANDRTEFRGAGDDAEVPVGKGVKLRVRQHGRHDLRVDHGDDRVVVAGRICRGSAQATSTTTSVATAAAVRTIASDVPSGERGNGSPRSMARTTAAQRGRADAKITPPAITSTAPRARRRPAASASGNAAAT